MNEPDDEFVAFVCEGLSPLGRVTARRMFGSVGLFLQGQMIALIDDGQFFIKVNQLLKTDTAFTYQRQGKWVRLRYVLLENWDTGDELLELIKQRQAKDTLTVHSNSAD